MRTRVDAQLRDEAARFELRYGCEHCAYFEVEGASCSEGFPNHEHRSRDLLHADELVFCKRFELS